MSRFYQAPMTQDIDYVVQPAGPAPDFSTAGDIFDQIRVLDQHAPQYQEIVDEYRAEMDDIARTLQRNPNAMAEVQPRMQRLRRAVQDDIMRGPIGQMSQRYKDMAGFRENISKLPPHIQAIYRDRVKVSDDFTQQLGLPNVAPNWTDADISKRFTDLAKGVPKSLIEEAREEIRALGSTRVLSLEDKVGVLGSRIAEFLDGVVSESPDLLNWFEVHAMANGRDPNEMIMNMVATVSEAYAQEEVKRQNITVRPSGTGRSQQRGTALFDHWNNIIRGESGDFYEATVGGHTVLQTDRESGPIDIANLTVSGEISPERLQQVQNSAFSSFGGNRPPGVTKAEDINLYRGEIIHVPRTTNAINVDRPPSNWNTIHNSVGVLTPGKSYVRIYPSAEAAAQRHESGMWVEFDHNTAPRILGHDAAVRNKWIEYQNEGGFRGSPPASTAPSAPQSVPQPTQQQAPTTGFDPNANNL